MISRVVQSSSMGALGRRFERDRLFIDGDFKTGPAVTPAGEDNGKLKLSFGTFRGLERPKTYRFGRFKVLRGANAKMWAMLSSMESSALVLGNRWALQW